MTRGFREPGKIGGSTLTSSDQGRAEPGIGKRTLVEQLPAPGAGAALPEAVRGRIHGPRLAQGSADRRRTMPMLADVRLRTRGRNQPGSAAAVGAR
jgi:hypothetical protein